MSLLHRRRHHPPAAAIPTQKEQVRHMKITELVAALQKAQQLVGDAPVILKDVEQGVETEFKSLEQEISLSTGESAGSITLTHGPASTEPAPASEPTPAGDTAEQAPTA